MEQRMFSLFNAVVDIILKKQNNSSTSQTLSFEEKTSRKPNKSDGQVTTWKLIKNIQSTCHMSICSGLLLILRAF